MTMRGGPRLAPDLARRWPRPGADCSTSRSDAAAASCAAERCGRAARGAIRASPSGARWKRACSRPTCWCWAASTRAPGRRKARSIPGSTARCAGLRPAGAGAQDRPFRARFPAGDGRAQGAADPRRARRRRADRPLALAAPADGPDLRGRGCAKQARSSGRRATSTARQKDEPAKRPMPRPGAAPPRGRRSCRSLEIETWRRDPYAIYARHPPQKLDPLDRSRRGPTSATRCTRLCRLHRRIPAARRGGLALLRPLGRAARQPMAFDRPRCLGLLAAALPAHRRLVARLGTRATRRHLLTAIAERAAGVQPRRPCFALHAPRRRPDRQAAGRRPRDHRLQDRHAASSTEVGAGLRAAAAPGSAHGAAGGVRDGRCRAAESARHGASGS